MFSDVAWKWLQDGLIDRRLWVRALTVLGICLVIAVPVGGAIGLLGPIYGTAAIVALVMGYLMLRSVIISLIVVVGIIVLLPFGALPINIGFSPTFLDVALIVTFFVWLCRLANHKDGEVITSAPTLGVLVFVALATVSFIAGLSHAAITANVLRHFAEILMSVLIFLLVINVLRTKEQLKWVVLALIIAGVIAAIIGIVLYFLPWETTVRILSMLRVVRYPTGTDVLRYVEDSTELPLRATSTSVDPNVLGGLLVFIGSLLAAQVMVKKPILSRTLSVPMLAIVALCMVLTFSRGSFVGLAVAFLMLCLFLNPKMIIWGIVAVGLLLLLPQAQAYVQRFIEGLAGQDQATQMRFGEYRDALALIARYPWLGVGFAGTPDIDTYIGVSSVYLLVAEEMGILGLVAFCATHASYLINFLKVHFHLKRGSDLDSLVYGPAAAIVGALVGGALDHYLFNLDFPHAAALLWLVVGLGTVAIRLAREESVKSG